MTTECGFCKGTGIEPGFTECVWCNNTGRDGGIQPAPIGELAAFRAYMAANPMATFWSAWQERARLGNAERDSLNAQLEQSQARRRQFAEEVNARLTVLDERNDVLEQRNAELLGIAQGLTVQLHDALGNTENHEDCIRDIAALNPKAESQPQRMALCHPDANEPPCSACFVRGCNGECMENLG